MMASQVYLQDEKHEEPTLSDLLDEIADTDVKYAAV
jgi:hypothetical protein